VASEIPIQETSKMPDVNHKMASLCFFLKPLILSFALALFLFGLIFVSGSAQVFPGVNFSFISSFLIFISFFSSFLAMLSVYFFVVQSLDIKNEASNNSFQILYIKLFGLLAIFLSYLAWFFLIQKEFVPPSSLERDVVVDLFKNMNPLVSLVPILGSVAFGSSLLWNRKISKHLVTLDDARLIENNQLVLVESRDMVDNTQDEKIQFKFISKKKLDANFYNNDRFIKDCIEIELKGKFDEDWLNYQEDGQPLRLAMLDGNYGFYIYVKKEAADLRKWKLKVNLKDGGKPLESCEF